MGNRRKSRFYGKMVSWKRMKGRVIKMAITTDQIKHVAKLSKLKFSDNELAGFTSQLGKIIDMVETLSEVDTEGVPVTTNVIFNHNVMRPDVAVKGTDRDLLMKNVPVSEAGYIKVPEMFDNGEAGA